MKWLLLSIFLLIVLGGLSVWVFMPAKGVLSAQDKSIALKNLLGRSPHLITQTVPTVWIPYKSTSLEFDYPSWAKIYTADNQKAKQPGVLDSFSFTLTDDHVSVVIQTVLFTGSLTEYPAVNVRLLQNSIYSVGRSSAAEMDFAKEQDIVERSVFFLKNGKVVSIAVTGYSDDKVQNLFDKLRTHLVIF